LNEPFWIGLKEGLQALICFLPLIFCPDLQKALKLLTIAVFTGILTGFAIGFFLPKNIVALKWFALRNIFDLFVLYSGIFFWNSKRQWTLLPIFFLLLLFDSREFGQYLNNNLYIKNSYSFVFSGIGGYLLGFVPLAGVRLVSRRDSINHLFTFPGTMLLIAGARMLFSGIEQFHKQTLITVLYKAVEKFLYAAVHYLQEILLLQEHPYIVKPLTEIGRFFYSERIAMATVLIILLIPPLWLLFNFFVYPEPAIEYPKKAIARLKLATFRKQTLLSSLPGFIVFFVVLGIFHAASLRSSTFYDPVATPVYEKDGLIILPVKGRLGILTDKKVHKFVYFSQSEEIVFLVVYKPDGTFGVALDQCEICRPPRWDKNSKGYAQRGGYLICKYCRTPIPLSTINSPGGCNPVPVPFELKNDTIVIKVSDLLNIFKTLESSSKKNK